MLKLRIDGYRDNNNPNSPDNNLGWSYNNRDSSNNNRNSSNNNGDSSNNNRNSSNNNRNSFNNNNFNIHNRIVPLFLLFGVLVITGFIFLAFQIGYIPVISGFGLDGLYT
jgi:hypothetical protein